MSSVSTPCHLLGMAGFSGSGKTTLLRALLPQLRAEGLRLAVIKHTHHNVEQDTPGKDSYELRHAGASQTLLAGPERSILTLESPRPQEPTLTASLAMLDTSVLDLVLVEGFRDEPVSKLEIHRPAHQKPLLCQHDRHILAVATDDPALPAPVPLLDLNQPHMITACILDWLTTGRLTVVAC
ncbi:molybdopterin-guanine dinucleotide biosynthesis protein B [Oceanimonas baumannii]|uniref:Molybdopterin-guanine dinucleotide biosynthesis protein B n=1 Tax=Oceanimonas baumannii TaxID=129578 RepID=A0A235CKV3_9GAMM|nr:molybdopterin-guanine dinucleotide biosynthesis protein B [Oceanimonas baumannii]OYD25170.1 molybdopterin-guanine dinucleotide biosynthesis protein B [Oceanimonas baumannii]TDW62542.1 molybdopterin-guanine dinucleotide biosynthesis protein B [Oceanimonas baumannii]